MSDSREKVIAPAYEFEQTDSDITISLPSPARYSLSDVTVLLSDSPSEVSVSLPDEPPVLCGIIIGPVLRYEISRRGNFARIQFVKSEHKLWPYFISGPSSRGIDSHSLFLLAITHHSWEMLCDSASRGSIQAQVEMARKFLSSDSANHNPSEALAILSAIPESHRTSSMQILLAEALVAIGNKEEAKAVLTRAARTFMEDRWEIIEMLKDLQEGDRPMVVDIQVTQFRGVAPMLHQVVERPAPSEADMTLVVIGGAALALSLVALGIWMFRKKK
jgi:hypothetical protein